MTHYEIESYENDENLEQPSKSKKKIDKKIWQKMLHDAQRKAQELSESMESKSDAFKTIYLETVYQEHLQR